MLAVTENAIDAIKQVAPGQAGLRVSTAQLPGPAGQDALQVEVVQQPWPEDQVLDAQGAHVFLEPRAATLLHNKILDATVEETSVRFAVADQRGSSR